MKLEYECDDCRGTGLYSGFCEAKGTAVVCLGCDGSGKAVFKYSPFMGRKKRTDIKTVSRSRGSFIGTGVGAVGKSVTYDEFLRGAI